MAISDSNAGVVFKNLNVAFNDTPLLNNIEEQTRRIDDTAARKALFRSDILVLAEGDIWTTTELLEKRDFLVTSGILNYAQAITHRLMTPRGYHPADPSFGVPWYDYIGQSYVNRGVIEAQLNADIAVELMKDPRTSVIRSVSSRFVDNNHISVECIVIPATTQNDTLGISLLAGV